MLPCRLNSRYMSRFTVGTLEDVAFGACVSAGRCGQNRASIMSNSAGTKTLGGIAKCTIKAALGFLLDSRDVARVVLGGVRYRASAPASEP